MAICGAVSENGRDYPDEVRNRDKEQYAGRNVYIDHGGNERKVREWFGVIQNPRTRVADRKTIGDHHYPKNSNFTAEYEERAEKFPSSLGFSHVAVCSTKRKNGREVIEAIRSVESVDLVARPATNKGISESTVNPMTFKEYAAKLLAKWPDNARVKLLAEADGADMGTDAAPVETAADPNAHIDAAFHKMLYGCIDKYMEDGDVANLMTTLKKALKAHGKMSAEPADKETPMDKEKESLQAEVKALREQIAQAKLESLTAGLNLTAIQLKAVEAMVSDDDRKAMVESFRVQIRGEKVKSGEPNPEQKHESKPASGIPTDGKAFAESLKNPTK